MPETTATLQQIPINQILPSPHQARKNFDDDSLLLLSQSMKEEGLIQPITVRTVDPRRGGPPCPPAIAPDSNFGQAQGPAPTMPTFELISGERRLRAAKLLGWTTISAIVQEGVGDQDAALKGLIENLQRVDLNPLEEARGLKQLAEPPFNLTLDAIGQKIGKKKAAVSKSLSLLDLAPEVQEMFPRGNISGRHGQVLVQIEDKNMQIDIARKIDKEGWSVNETERRVKEVLGKGESRRGGPLCPPAISSDPNFGQARGPAPTTPVADPLASFWHDMQVPGMVPFPGVWKAEWKDGALNLWAKPSSYSTPKSDFGRLFGTIAQFLMAGANSDGPRAEAFRGDELLAPTQEEQVQKDRFQRFAPSSRDEIDRVMQEMTKARLPETPAEEAKLYALAKSSAGPGPVYEAILGPGNFYTGRFQGVSWQEAGYRDAEAGSRDIVDNFRMALAHRKGQTPAPATTAGSAVTAAPPLRQGPAAAADPAVTAAPAPKSAPSSLSDYARMLADLAKDGGLL
jgi:ParB family chromosome partitioning protein